MVTDKQYEFLAEAKKEIEGTTAVLCEYEDRLNDLLDDLADAGDPDDVYEIERAISHLNCAALNISEAVDRLRNV